MALNLISVLLQKTADTVCILNNFEKQLRISAKFMVFNFCVHFFFSYVGLNYERNNIVLSLLAL